MAGSGTKAITGALEYESYCKSLQLSTNQELSKVHQVYLPIIQKLMLDRQFATDEAAKSLLDRLIQGEKLEVADVKNAYQTATYKQAEQGRENQLIGLIKQANQEYKDYCDERRDGFLSILETYDSFRFKTDFWGPIRRWRNGRSYKGKYDDAPAYQSFIQLIDQISLIDTTGSAVAELLRVMKIFEGKAFNYEAQCVLMNTAYALLLRFQASFFQTRDEEDSQELKDLVTDFQVTDAKHLEAYYHFILYKKEPEKPEYKKQPDCNTENNQTRLIFEIHQIRDQRADDRDGFKTELKKLKKNIHHVAQELGLPSRLKTSREFFDDFIAAREADLQAVLTHEKAELTRIFNEDYEKNKQTYTEAGITKDWLEQISSAIEFDGFDFKPVRDFIIPAEVAAHAEKKQPDVKTKAYQNIEDLIEKKLFAQVDRIAAIKKYHRHLTDQFSATVYQTSSPEENKSDEKLFATYLKETEKTALKKRLDDEVKQFATRLRIPEVKAADDEQEIEKKRNEEIRTELEMIYRYEHDVSKCKVLISEDQQKKREQEQWNSRWASRSSKVTSIGEAFVAASQIALIVIIGSPLVIMVAMLIMAFYINNLLFGSDNKSVMDALFLKKKVKNPDGSEEEHRLIFFDKDGKLLSKPKRWFIKGAFILTVSTGVTYGALSFLSTYGTVPVVLSQVGLFSLIQAHAPMLLLMLQIGGAAFPALGMAIGITCIFYKVIADFIREKRWITIPEYFKVNFLLKNGNEKSAFWTMDDSQKRWHIAKCVGRAFLLTLAVAVTALVTIFSAGFFYNDSLKFLHYMSHCNPMSGLAKTATWINAIISAPFQIDGPNKVLQPKAGFRFSNKKTEKTSECSFAAEIAPETEITSSPSQHSTSSTGVPSSPDSPPSTHSDISDSSGGSKDSKEGTAKPEVTYQVLEQLIQSNVGYITHEQKLYYINKQNQECTIILDGEKPGDKEKLDRYEQIIQREKEKDNQFKKTASCNSLVAEITSIIGHTPMGSLSPIQRDAEKCVQFQKAFALISSLGNGIGYSATTVGSYSKRPSMRIFDVGMGAFYSGVPNYKAAANGAAESLRAPRFLGKKPVIIDEPKKGEAPARWRAHVPARLLAAR